MNSLKKNVLSLKGICMNWLNPGQSAKIDSNKNIPKNIQFPLLIVNKSLSP